MEKVIEVLVKIALTPESVSGRNQRDLYRKQLREYWAHHEAAEQTVAPPSYARKVAKALTELGVPAHLIGHAYLMTAIQMVMSSPRRVKDVTTWLYPGVAKVHGTTASKVERAMRHAVETSWERASMDALDQYFGNTTSRTKGKPTNSEFIYGVANYLQLEGPTNEN